METKSSGNEGRRREFDRGCKCKPGGMEEEEEEEHASALRRCVEEECERFVGKRLDKGRADWPDIPIRAEISDPINSVLLPTPLPFPLFSLLFFLLLLPLFRSLPSIVFFPAVQLSKRNNFLYLFFLSLFHSISTSTRLSGEILRVHCLSFTARACERNYPFKTT